jgi:hypothetical protein
MSRHTFEISLADLRGGAFLIQVNFIDLMR